MKKEENHKKAWQIEAQVRSENGTNMLFGIYRFATGVLSMKASNLLEFK